MKRILAALIASAVLAAIGVSAAPRRTLDIYFIDVEGGQSTLIVTPAGQSLLVDAGFPGTGTFDSTPGDPHAARDANRVLAAARAAGITKIDYLLVTHFHGDHDGGVVELSQLMPIRTFVDHATVPAKAEENVPGTLALFKAYEQVRARGRRVVPKVGSQLPLIGVGVQFVSTAGTTLARPLPGAGQPNAACGAEVPAQEPNENPRSTAFRLAFGKFIFLDLGDLTGAPLHALVCPKNLIGPVDVYLAAHHGGLDAADPATLAAFAPEVAVIDNGPRKGGTPEMLAALRQATGIDVYQLHRSIAAGDGNVADERIANLDTSTAHWIKVSARRDGSFDVTNGRTGASKSYVPKHPNAGQFRPSGD